MLRHAVHDLTSIFACDIVCPFKKKVMILSFLKLKGAIDGFMESSVGVLLKLLFGVCDGKCFPSFLHRTHKFGGS